MTALFGALAVYAAWLLAAQVFRDARLQLLAAFIGRRAADGRLTSRGS